MSQKNSKQPCNEFGSEQAQQKSQSKQATGKSGSGSSNATGKSKSEFSSNG